ncbi:MAG: ABC transporter permease [Polyangiaceae bacterium]|nr:ABC transporter permease [Polyangiaceae bacterium]
MTQLLLLSWRSIWRHPRRTVLTIASMSLALALAVVFLAIGDGLYGRLLHEVLRMQSGQLTVEHARYLDAPSVNLAVDRVATLRAKLERLPAVATTKVLVVSQGVANSADGAVGVAVVGVEPTREAALSPLPKRLVAGRYLDDQDDRRAVLGVESARQLKVGVGDKLVLSGNDVDGQLVQEMARVKGIFRTGALELDGHLVQVPIGFGRKLFGLRPEQATEVGILLDSPDAETPMLEQVRTLLRNRQELAVWPWQKIIPELSTFMKVDKGSNVVFQVVILLMAAFTIFNTVLMSALERKREFAVMLALGTPPRRVKFQLLLESVALGAVGSLVGVLLGSGVSAWLDGYDLTRWLGDGMEVGGFLMDPVLHLKLTLLTTVGLGAAMTAAVALMSLVPMARLKHIRVTDAFR